MSEPDAALPEAGLPEADFRAIETALRRSARGRAFLGDVARRNRAAETRMMLDAVARLERALAGRVAQADAPGSVGTDPVPAACAGEVAEPARAEEAGPPAAACGSGLEGLLVAARAATAAARAAVERIQDLAWAMRESGSDPALCDALDREASTIGRACDARAATDDGFARVGRIIRDVERRMATGVRSAPARPMPPVLGIPALDLASEQVL